ncbi:MAG: pyridoxal phosphate-dependent decarboxylase family protein [Spirochaetota bacterium]
MDRNEFVEWAHEVVDWMAWYYDHIEEFPVRSRVAPGDIMRQLPVAAPEQGEAFDEILADFKEIILPGMTHWQHPKFFAYFPANSSYPSVLAEMLTAALAAQGMIWQTSPSATELEERIMGWLRDLIGLPRQFEGVIQDTASTSTLVALLTAREVKTGFRSNEEGLSGLPAMTVYASEQTHSSIEKDVKIAGFGRANYRPLPVDESFAMKPAELEAAIIRDEEAGLTPCCVVATIGTTGSTAIDPLRDIVEIAGRHALWVHVDAALAGSALVLPEHRSMIDGIDGVDSFVFNPHKWLFTNFDCSAYFVRDKAALLRTFEIHPEYLKTAEGATVNNYRDWGIQLGRRFRSLKLWFVLRSFGAERIRAIIGEHIRLAGDLASRIDAEPDFERLAPTPLNTVCFHYVPRGGAPGGGGAGARGSDLDTVNALNRRILDAVNESGKAYITHTTLNGVYTLRFVVGQTNTTERHVNEAWELITETARALG